MTTFYDKIMKETNQLIIQIKNNVEIKNKKKWVHAISHLVVMISDLASKWEELDVKIEEMKKKVKEFL